MTQQTDRLKRIFISVLVIGLLTLCVLTVGIIGELVIMLPIVSVANIPGSASLVPDVLESQSAREDNPANSSVESDSDEIALSRQNLTQLELVEIPQNDPVELARIFLGVEKPRVQLSEPAIRFENGAVKKFWILDVDQNSYRQINADLIYQTPHLFFWVEEHVPFDSKEVVQLANIFEDQIYPSNRELFGSEWQPGVDNDDHLVIVYARQLGGAAGYFSGTDSLLPEVKPFSNAAEMFYLSADFVDLNSLFTYGVLAHEFQHMIHWHQDRNEASWLNEGLSELAVEINGFDIGGFDYLFAGDPDLSLIFWPGNDQGDSSPHYGASYLFMKYILTQYGRQAITDLSRNPRNGLASVDDIARAYIPDTNPQLDKLADHLFQNWTIANLLQENSTESGLYGYGGNAHLPPFQAGEEIGCGAGWQERSVQQYGTDYVELTCDGSFTIALEADPTVDLLPVKPHSGNYHFWSNRGDESDMRLSREFDLTNIGGLIRMQFWTWFDIERDYDYLYLTASSEGGESEILQPQGCTRENSTGANYGCGYNGQSDGWVLQTVDLSPYSGKKVKLRFEYVTDAAVNGEGFLIDDISMDALGYATDFEESDGGWMAEGFVRVTQQIPQAFSVAIVHQGEKNNVEKWITTAGLQEEWLIQPTVGENTILIISGLARHTHTPASYRVLLTRVD